MAERSWSEFTLPQKAGVVLGGAAQLGLLAAALADIRRRLQGIFKGSPKGSPGTLVEKSAMEDEYKVYVVDLGEGSVVVDETFDPLHTYEEAVDAADGCAAEDRDDDATGLAYEVVALEGGRVSDVVYWTMHRGGGVVDSGVDVPPWHI